MKKRFVAALILSLAILTGCGKNAESEVSVEASSAYSVPEAEESVVEATKEITTEPLEASKEESAIEASSAASEASTATSKAETASSKEQPAAAEASTAAPEAPKAESSSEASSIAPVVEETTAPPVEEKKDYGRIIFIGDSRTVDIFNGEAYEIYDLNVGNARVFAENCKGYDYMTELLNRYDGQYDTVITWLGCNDHRNIESYKAAYEGLISRGINLVICNVGPTQSEWLDEGDSPFYQNDSMVSFNQQIGAWAADHGVKVIDMYSYVYSNLQIDSDGIHYSPKENNGIWNYIMNSL
ncbi:SGNH/GDSL hydrolase family protein [Butyrivibrio sp. MC2021]|uniref:SGNH/GDSL hydrolase family protein n=1 Tax=Butyrivibrio sp. MC2021 TaxID=1408306 RepID=UPI00055BCCB6|nr:SGNH/GDSL hydrolase family protein [Butyrivibrio sp. MC2021]